MDKVLGLKLKLDFVWYTDKIVDKVKFIRKY